VTRRLAGVAQAAPALIAVALGAALAGCSSTPNAASTTTTGASGQTTTTAPSSTTTSSSGASSSSSTATTAIAPQCSPGGLAIAVDQGDTTNGAGSTHLAISLTNTGAATCSLDGYPAVQLLGASGGTGGSGASGSSSSSSAPSGASSSSGPAAEPASSSTPSVSATSAVSPGPGGPVDVSVTDVGPAAHLVNLGPKQSAGFYLLYNTVPVNGVGCTDVSSVQVTPPGTSESLALGTSFSACGGSVGVYAVVPLASLAP